MRVDRVLELLGGRHLAPTASVGFVHDARQTTYEEAPAAIAMLYPQLAQGKVYQMRYPR